MTARKVLSALDSSGTHNGDSFEASGPHLLFYTREASSTLTLQVKDPNGDWQTLEQVSSGSSDGVVVVHMGNGMDHRVITPNSGYQAEAWVVPSGDGAYVYAGGV